MDIQVQPMRLVETSNEIINVKNELLNIMEEIEILVLSLNGSWQGDAERAFAEKIIYVKNQFSSISAFFDDYSELLKTFAAGYQQLEADISSKINQA